jgi:hypothetical protein
MLNFSSKRFGSMYNKEPATMGDENPVQKYKNPDEFAS